MAMNSKNWMTQIKKGYLELCVLNLIQTQGRLYGFQLIKLLEQNGIFTKEGTVYPLLNRMTQDQILSATWETQDVKGHPRKFYSLSNAGLGILEEMKTEFDQMYLNYKSIDEVGGKDVKSRVRRLSR